MSDKNFNLTIYNAKYHINKEKIMKNFVVKFGGFVVDIMAILTLIGLIISTFKMFVSQGLWAGLGTLWAGLVSFVFVFFTIYLIMSINDKLSNNDRY